MDWVQKYNLGIIDLEEVQWLVKFYFRDYGGDLIELLGAEDPINFDFQNESDDPFAPIKASQVTISVEEIKGIFTIADLYSIEDKNCYVEIYQEANLYWTGYVDPKQYKEPYDVAPYIIDITCIDGLTLLDDMPFMLNEDTELVWRRCHQALVYYNGRMLESRIIFAILERIVLDEEGDSEFQGVVTFNEYINIYEILMNNSINDSPLDQTMIDVDVFKGMSCGDALRKLLGTHNACIRQRNGIFCIYRPKEVIKSIVYGRQFVGTFAIGTQTKTSISYVPTQYINRVGHNTNIKQVSGGNVMPQPLAKKVNIKQDYGNKESWLNNWELGVETWNGVDFEYWTQEPNNSIRLISNEQNLRDETAGLVIPARNTHRLYSVYQSFAINAIPSETDNFVFSFDYLHSNYSGIEIPHIYLNVSVKAHGINTYLYGLKVDQVSNQWELGWADLPMILDDQDKCFITIHEDVPAGGTGWKTFKGKVVGLPAGGVYTITLYNSYGWTNQDHTETITTAFKNVRFYAASMELSAMTVRRTLKEKYFNEGQVGWVTFLLAKKTKSISYQKEVENIVEHTYTKNNNIAGEELDYDHILGDVITTSPLLYKGDVNIENILEQFAGALATTGGLPQKRVDIVTLHLNSLFFPAQGTAIITCSGISKTATYNSSLAQTALDFKNSFVLFWAAIGITLTNSGASILFTSNYVGVEFIGSTTIATQIGLLDGDVTYTPSHESGIHPTTKWNTRGGVEDKPLLEIVGDEIALQYSRPAQFIDMPLQETSGESTLNLLGNIQDDMNQIGEIGAKTNIGFVVNRGSFGVRYRQWKLDLVDMVGVVEEGIVVDNEAPTALVLTVVSNTRIDLVWVDNDGDEDGFSIERSTDGITYAEIDTVAANVETYSSISLTECTQYYYRVRAYTGAIYTPYSNVANNYTLLLPPTTLAASSVANTQISLSWTDNSSNEEGFKIERGLSDIAFVVIATTAAGVVSYLDIDLAENTQYFYRIRAFKGTQFSTYSNIDDATTSELLAPTLLTSLAVSDTEIDLAWVENAVNEDGYIIESSLDGIAWTVDAFINSDLTSYQCINLTEGTRYYYRLRAYKWRAGESGVMDSDSSYGAEVDYSEYSNITFDTTLPAAPTLLVMAAITDTEIDLEWVDNSNHEDGYEVERSLDGVTWEVIVYAGVLIEAFPDTDLEEYTHYYYRVRAFKSREVDDLDELDSDSEGSPESDYSLYSNTVDSYTLLKTPTDLTVTAISDIRIDLKWEDNSDKEEGYKIERSVDNVVFTVIDSIVVDSAEGDFYQDTPLTPHTFYYYRVRAFAANGYSAYSNMAHVYTKLPIDIIDFASNALPGIANYNTAVIVKYDATYAAIFGPYPNVRLMWYDENGDWIPWMQEPKYTVVDGLLVSIIWNLGFEATGFIILQ